MTLQGGYIMEISTFKDENYEGLDGSPLFSFITVGKKNPTKIIAFVYQNRDNLDALLEIAKNLPKVKAKFERLFDKSLSDIEFFKIYKSFYRWDNDAIIAKSNAGAFPHPQKTIIKTNDVVDYIESEGHGRDFSWWTEWKNVAYEVLTNKDFQFEDKTYTKKEIEKFVKEKKMIVLRTDIPYGNELNPEEAHKTSIEMKKINVTPNKLNFNFKLFAYALHDEQIKEMYLENPEAFRVIREDLTEGKLMQDYQKYVAQYDIAMAQIFDALKRCSKMKNSDQFSNKTIEDIKKFLSQKQGQQTSQTNNEKEMDK